MGMVVAESSIPVSSLVQEFNKIGKSKFETEKSLIIECEIEIKGIVKKVVKVKSGSIPKNFKNFIREFILVIIYVIFAEIGYSGFNFEITWNSAYI